MNLIVRPEFELAHYDVAILYVNHNATVTFPGIMCRTREKEKEREGAGIEGGYNTEMRIFQTTLNFSVFLISQYTWKG